MTWKIALDLLLLVVLIGDIVTNLQSRQRLPKMKTTRPWYTPSGFLLRLFRYAAHATADPQIVAASAFTYGAIDLLGVQGTVKLILKLRRHHASTKRRPAKSNSQMF